MKVLFVFNYDIFISMKLTYADIISSLALITATTALVWNIIRDLILDRVSIKLDIKFGEIGNIKNSMTALFVEAGSLKPVHKFDKVGMLVKIINTGRREIVVSGVGGKLIDGNDISMAVDGLPKLLKPYEEFSSLSEIKVDFKDMIINKKILELWAQDTKGKKWLLTAQSWKNLSDSAEYINLNKHI